MGRSILPGIEPPSVEGWPAPIAAWQHTGQSGQFQVRIDLVRGIGRAGGVPEVTLSHESGGSNGIFGLGWSLDVPSIVRGNGRYLPRYRDFGPEADAFSASDFGELVPVLTQSGTQWLPETLSVDGIDVVRYRPRIDSAFIRIERRTDPETGGIYWQTVSRDNVTRVFGRTADARVADPSDPHRIARWLLEDQWDSYGNRIHVEYKREDLAGVSEALSAERHRLASGQPESLLHIKRVQWGNAAPYESGDWLFELVFDYGEHDRANPSPDEQVPWALRPDAFSNFRAGFEQRTRRLCQRVLLFHHSAGRAYLTRSHEFTYESTSANSLLAGATLRGYRRGADGLLQTETLPATRFDYSTTQAHGPVRDVRCQDGTTGLGGLASAQQWLDLEGTALPGLVSREPGGAVYYRPNLGDGRIGSPVVLQVRPSLTDTALPIDQSIGQPFGDSRSCLVDLAKGPGYQERIHSGDWLPYTPFQEAPTVRANALGPRSLDLDGDGRADLLLAGEHGAQWHPFEGRKGWAAVREAIGTPSVWEALADRTGTVLLADMTGDGLADFVQVNPGSVRYWPNLGYGRFAEPVQMAGSPMLEGPDVFDPARVRLVDIDGSGPADLVYLGRGAVTWYPNQSGNSFGAPQTIANLPVVTDLDSIDVVDLLGTGTGCLVWSSVAPGQADWPVRYIELVGGQRPHLLTTVQNGQGVEVRVTYTPSTRLMLDDRAAGKAWHTTLPFPAWLVTEIHEADLVSGTGQISTWAYRHGYYDDVARETRGFAYVEQRDQAFVPDDPVDPALSHPLPVRETRTWYHTGAFAERTGLDAKLAADFYAGDPARPARPDLAVENDAGVAPRELLRALQGRPLREEVYGLGPDDASAHPYTVVDHGYLLRALQPNSPTAEASVAVFARESVERSYERIPDDPRVAHHLVIAIDGFGNTTEDVAVAYPRRRAEQPEQRRIQATLNERTFANRAYAPDGYRVGVPVTERSYELGPLPPPAPGELFRVEDFQRWLSAPGLHDLPFEQSLPDTGSPQRRLIRAAETYFWNDTLTDSAPLGEVGRLALAHHQRQAAFSPALLGSIYGAEAPDLARLAATGYEFDRGLWWARGSQVTYDTAAFHLPVDERTALGAEYRIRYDAHRLFVAETRDPVGNVQRAEYDYQALAAVRVIDPNSAGVQVSFDAFGLPIALAMAGARGEGDALAAPTIRIERDPLAWQRDGTPLSRRVATRVQHANPASPWERQVTYLNGHGQALQQKRLAESAPGETAQRWVMESYVAGTVRRYAPGFTLDERFTPEPELAHLPIARSRYDALGRAIESRRADGALSRTSATPWRTQSWDSNDAVRDSDWFRTRRRAGASAQETAEADAAERHAGTPSAQHLDPAGRAFLEVQDGGAAGLVSTRMRLTVSEEALAVTDARGIETERREYDMLGRALRTRSTASGETHVFPDAEGEPVQAWGANGQQQHWFRDLAGRPIRREVRPLGGDWRVVEHIVWGEDAPGAEGYHRGRPYLNYDSAGQLKVAAYDFRGNPLLTERAFRADLTVTADWRILAGLTAAVDIERAASTMLNAEPPLATRMTYDALDRPLTRTTPDGSVTAMDYGPRGLAAEIRVTVDGRTTRALQDPVYDAAGRRLSARLGSGVRETAAYDERAGLLTGRSTVAPGGLLRDLGFSYDAVGNVLGVTDAGQQTRYFRNAVVSPDRTFTYDALYRLRSAEGREAAVPPLVPNRRFEPPIRSVPDANDLTAVRRYTESYEYDRSGNLTRLEHQAGSGGNWTVRYGIDPASDRITGLRDRNGVLLPGSFSYDPAGNALTLGGLSGLLWNEDEQLKQADREGGGTAYYTYDGAGRRAAKVIVQRGGTREERFYLDGYEVYRQVTGTGRLAEEATTLHVPDGEGRLLLVERRVAGDGNRTTWWRYQHADQVGSCSLETDQDGQILSFEEFRPYGTTAYHAAQPVSLPKRYRFGGQENDNETGLNYHGARYYAPWLCQWISADPAGMADGTNRYWFVRGNPATLSDPSGTQSMLRYGPGGMELHMPEQYRTPDYQVHYQSSRDASGNITASVQVYHGACRPPECQSSPIYSESLESRIIMAPSSHPTHAAPSHGRSSGSLPHDGSDRRTSPSRTTNPAGPSSSTAVEIGPATPLPPPPSSRLPDLSNPVEAEHYAVQTAPNASSPSTEGPPPLPCVAEQVAQGLWNAAMRRLPDRETLAVAAILPLGPIAAMMIQGPITARRTAEGLERSIRQHGWTGPAHLLPPVQIYDAGARTIDALERGDYTEATEAAVDATEATVNTTLLVEGLPSGIRAAAGRIRRRLSLLELENFSAGPSTPQTPEGFSRPRIGGAPVGPPPENIGPPPPDFLRPRSMPATLDVRAPSNGTNPSLTTGAAAPGLGIPGLPWLEPPPVPGRPRLPRLPWQEPQRPLPERMDLGLDPARGAFSDRPLNASRNPSGFFRQYLPIERNTALRLQQRLGIRLERFRPPIQNGAAGSSPISPPKGDWIDPLRWETYDGCSPAPTEFFDRGISDGAYERSLLEHLNNPTVNYVVVDITELRLTFTQQAELAAIFSRLTLQQLARVIYLR